MTMHSILQRIHDYKREEVRTLASLHSRQDLESMAREVDGPRGFRTSLEQAAGQGYGLVAELKKSSPSKGLIRDDFQPAMLAASYAEGGATCLSVLTDMPSFQGQPEYLTEAANAVSLPVLRKDFMIDPLQSYEARVMRADCILIIMGLVGDGQAEEIESAAIDCGMDVLVEVHDQQELERSRKLKSRMIGINNRNLNTFEVNLATTIELMEHVEPGSLVISESGFFTSEDLAFVAMSGVRCFLVGESLMRQDDVAGAVRNLLSNQVPAGQVA